MGVFSSITDGIGLTSYGEQEAAIRRAAGRFGGLTPPEIKALELEQVGEYTPDEARAILSEGSAFQDVYADPRLKAAQQDALEQLQGIADAGGLTASDKAMLSDIARQERAQERGQREAITQQSQMKGIGGSGIELAQKMIAQQGSATRQSARDEQVAAMAEQRKLAALQQAGQLGGQMRSQEFGEQSQVAQAQDLMERFNLANRQNVEMSNVEARNRAQAMNLSTAQDIANQKAQWAAQAPQQRFQNQLGLASGMAGMDQKMAQMYGQQSQQGMQMAGMAAMAMAKSDERVKEKVDIAPEEIDNFLNELTGYKFNYKDPEKHGEGQKIGVMAQDMEKSELGAQGVFEDEEGVKTISGGDSLNAILAGLSHLNEKVNDLEDKDGK